MPSNAAAAPEQLTSAPAKNPSLRWFVCFLFFAATTINYMDRGVFSFIEPTLHHVAFMGWNLAADQFHQPVFDNNYGNVVICFQIAYGVGYLFAGRIIDRLGTKTGYALAIGVWAFASMSHSLVTSVLGFCVARIFLGLGESGNFPAAIKGVSEWFPTEERGKAVGLFNSGTNVSFFLAPLLIGFAVSHYNWRAAFIATSSLGLIWLAVWLLFPYNKYRRDLSPRTQQELSLPLNAPQPYWSLLTSRGNWAFALGKGLTDGVWWFYLFYLPQFLNRNYGLDLTHARWEIITVYLISSVGSIWGGSLSGWLMNRGLSINQGRKYTMLLMALFVLPLLLVPHTNQLFPANPWPATLIIALAAAAHQGWSANLFSTPADMFPSTTVSTVIGFGGAFGSACSAAFTVVVKRNLSLHPLVVFASAAGAYLIALAVIHLLVPRLGAVRSPAQPDALA